MGVGGGEAVPEGGEDGEEAAEAWGLGSIGSVTGFVGKGEDVWWGRASGTRRDFVREIGGREGGVDGVIQFRQVMASAR